MNIGIFLQNLYALQNHSEKKRILPEFLQTIPIIRLRFNFIIFTLSKTCPMDFWYFTPVAIVYFLASGISIFVSIAAWRMHPVRGARLFSVMMMLVTIWVLSYSLGTFSTNFEFKILMLKLEYLGMAGAVYLWLVFVAIYTQYDFLLKPWVLISIGIIPLFTIYNILQAPNDTLIHEAYIIEEVKGILTFKKNFTGGFYLWTAHSYLMMLTGILFLVLRIVRMPKAMHRQLYFLVSAILIIIFPNIFFIVDNNPIEPFDPTPLALVVVGILFLTSIFYHKFLDVAPVAHELVFKNMKSGVIITDSRLSVIETNPAVKIILNKQDKELLGAHLFSILPFLKKMIDPAFNTPEVNAEIGLGDDNRTYEVKITPFRDKSNNPYGLVIVLWDITEQKQALSELDAYARTVAHDLKSPLGQMIGIAKLLKEGLIPDFEKDDYLSNLLGTGEKAKDIIDGLLMLAKLRNIESMEVLSLNMEKIVQSAIVRLTDKINKFEVVINQPTHWISSKGNSLWIEEVWFNLLSNAIKYGGSPPSIQIDGTIENNMAVWSVTDNGLALNLNEQKEIFNEFSRVHPQKDTIKGHGLGLPIVKRIVAKSGGEVGIRNNQNNKGNTFYFSLPL